MPQRLFWLDFLRGLAALTVVVFHYHHFYLRDYLDRPNIPPTSDFPYASILGLLYSEYAASAVQLFWMISGIVFIHVYKIRHSSIVGFSVARFARLYPLHLVTLFFVAALQYISTAGGEEWQIYGNNDPRHFLLQLFFLSNSVSLSRGLSFDGPIWSVSLEIPVYFLFFLSLPLLRRMPFQVSFSFAALSAALYILKPDLPIINIGVFHCAFYFFSGVAVYRLAIWSQRSKSSGLVLLASFGGMIAGGYWSERSGVVVFGAVSALSLVALWAEMFFRPEKNSNWLGELSYAIYLIHVPIQICILSILNFYFDGRRELADSPYLLPAYVFATLLVAHILHYHFEVPVGQKIRNLFFFQNGKKSHKEV